MFNGDRDRPNPSIRSKSSLAAASGLSIGVGIQLGRTHDGDIVIISLAPGGPCERSGKVFPNDILLEIDGEPAGSSIYEAADKLRGAEGTSVTLKVTRPGIFGRDFEIVRLTRTVMAAEAPAPPQQVRVSSRMQSENHIFQAMLPDITGFASSGEQQRPQGDNILSGLMSALRMSAPEAQTTSSGINNNYSSKSYNNKGGLGIALSMCEEGPVIASLAVNGPAARSNRVRKGDIIVTVDGLPVEKTLEGVSQQLSGMPGTSVLLKLRRHGLMGDEIEIAHFMREDISDGIYYEQQDSQRQRPGVTQYPYMKQSSEWQPEDVYKYESAPSNLAFTSNFNRQQAATMTRNETQTVQADSWGNTRNLYSSAGPAPTRQQNIMKSPRAPHQITTSPVLVQKRATPTPVRSQTAQRVSRVPSLDLDSLGTVSMPSSSPSSSRPLQAQSLPPAVPGVIHDASFATMGAPAYVPANVPAYVPANMATPDGRIMVDNSGTLYGSTSSAQQHLMGVPAYDMQPRYTSSPPQQQRFVNVASPLPIPSDLGFSQPVMSGSISVPNTNMMAGQPYMSGSISVMNQRMTIPQPVVPGGMIAMSQPIISGSAPPQQMMSGRLSPPPHMMTGTMPMSRPMMPVRDQPLYGSVGPMQPMQQMPPMQHVPQMAPMKQQMPQMMQPQHQMMTSVPNNNFAPANSFPIMSSGMPMGRPMQLNNPGVMYPANYPQPYGKVSPQTSPFVSARVVNTQQNMRQFSGSGLGF